jgi:hypothetical protein
MAFRLSRIGPKLRDYHRTWYASLQEKAKGAEDMNTLSALGSIVDYYGQEVNESEIAAKNNYEVKWEDWSHLMTPGIVDSLKSKVEAIEEEEYNTTELAEKAADESEDLRKLRHYLTWNGELHKNFYDERADLIENINHAQPFDTMNYWEVKQMYKYEDVASRWD